jgi:hypothetical protein
MDDLEYNRKIKGMTTLGAVEKTQNTPTTAQNMSISIRI